MLSLSFDAVALERCFLVADVLAQEFGQPFLEYGLIGLSASSRPLHVVETPLLPGQRVTSSSIEQRGSAVLRLRREMNGLSLRTGQRLLPVAFIHRHPTKSTRPSATDDAFLRSVFVSQVSTVVTLPELPPDPGFPAPCDCDESGRNSGTGEESPEAPGVAFSLIVTRDRDYSLQAVAKLWCAHCGGSRVCDVPAQLARDSGDPPSPERLAELRESLKQEIEEKFNPQDLEA